MMKLNLILKEKNVRFSFKRDRFDIFLSMLHNICVNSTEDVFIS